MPTEPNPTTLPPKALRMWESVFESSKRRGFDSSRSAQQAWAVVKRRYKKQGDRWLLRKKPIKQPPRKVANPAPLIDDREWKRLDPDPKDKQNHVRWEIDGIEVKIVQPDVKRSDCEDFGQMVSPETCAQDSEWITQVDGMTLEEEHEDTLYSHTPFSAREAAVPVIVARRKAAPMPKSKDFQKLTELDLLRVLHGIRLRGYNVWEVVEFATANDPNGHFNSMLLDTDLAKSYIDELYDEWLEEYGISRDEVEGRDPTHRKRDEIMRGMVRNPAERKRRLMR